MRVPYGRLILSLLLALLLAPTTATAQAQSDDDLPIFDAHIHYNRDAWGLYSVDDALALLDRAGVRKAFVSSTPDQGTLMLWQRAPERISPYPGWAQKIGNIVNQGIFPGMMGGGQGQLALNQLLVTMDGIDNPPFFRRFFTNRVNSFLDAIYLAPRRIGRISLRLPKPRPLGAQIYFIGATNVPFERLDPALTRPGCGGAMPISSQRAWRRTASTWRRVEAGLRRIGTKIRSAASPGPSCSR